MLLPGSESSLQSSPREKRETTAGKGGLQWAFLRALYP